MDEGVRTLALYYTQLGEVSTGLVTEDVTISAYHHNVEKEDMGMTQNGRILALHLDPKKQGVRIERQKYEAIKAAILAAIAEARELPFSQLTEAVEARLIVPFDGSVGWYTTTVKLDLEARGLIERVPGKQPQHLRLAG
jgi:hypothetical protein